MWPSSPAACFGRGPVVCRRRCLADSRAEREPDELESPFLSQNSFAKCKQWTSCQWPRVGGNRFFSQAPRDGAERAGKVRALEGRCHFRHRRSRRCRRDSLDLVVPDRSEQRSMASSTALPPIAPGSASSFFDDGTVRCDHTGLDLRSSDIDAEAIAVGHITVKYSNYCAIPPKMI